MTTRLIERYLPIAEIGIERLAAKSRALSDYLRAAIAQVAPDLLCVSPDGDTPRGSHLSYRHPDAYALCQALIARGVIGDFRAGDPELLRFGFAPLYNGFADVVRAVDAIADIVSSRSWKSPEFTTRNKVT